MAEVTLDLRTLSKAEAYEQLDAPVREGTSDPIAAMATISALIHHASDCDARSRSEIVVPILNRGGVLVAVLDIDAAVPNALDENDQRGLERIVSWFADY